MTDEEMGEEYFKATYPSYIGCDKFTEDIKDAVIYGLKAGRPQWHKITDWKNQEQFPDNICKEYLVYVNLKYLEIKQYMVCILDITEGYRQFYLEDGNDSLDNSIDPEDVIAWCELPTFDKE